MNLKDIMNKMDYEYECNPVEFKRNRELARLGKTDLDDLFDKYINIEKSKRNRN